MSFSEYIKQPATIWKLVIAIFVLWSTYSYLYNSVADNTSRLDTIEEMNIDVTIMQIQTDIAWIRQSLESKDI